MSETATQRRGELTERVKDKAKELLGYDISQEELRLIPYIVYELTNGGTVDRAKMNLFEREVLKVWGEKGWFTKHGKNIAVTKEFWGMLNEILWLGYVDLID